MTMMAVQNWTALYAATTLCSLIAAMLSTVSLGHELIRERAWSGITSLPAGLLFFPRIWWRWQKRYLTAAPATLSIVAIFAVTLRW